MRENFLYKLKQMHLLLIQLSFFKYQNIINKRIGFSFLYFKLDSNIWKIHTREFLENDVSYFKWTNIKNLI